MYTVGTVCITAHGSRELGMFCSSSSVTLVVVVSRLRSITGVAAVTFTVSVVPATPSLAEIGVAEPLTTCTVLLANVLKPASDALTA